MYESFLHVHIYYLVHICGGYNLHGVIYTQYPPRYSISSCTHPEGGSTAAQQVYPNVSSNSVVHDNLCFCSLSSELSVCLTDVVVCVCVLQFLRFPKNTPDEENRLWRASQPSSTESRCDDYNKLLSFHVQAVIAYIRPTEFHTCQLLYACYRCTLTRHLLSQPHDINSAWQAVCCSCRFDTNLRQCFRRYRHGRQYQPAHVKPKIRKRHNPGSG